MVAANALDLGSCWINHQKKRRSGIWQLALICRIR